MRADDVRSAEAMAIQARVLRRAREEMERQVMAVDEALREVENDMVQDLRVQRAELAARWAGIRQRRDAALRVLDRQAMVGCPAEGGELEQGKEEDMDNDDDEDLVDDEKGVEEETTAIMAQLRSHHQEMQELEEHVSSSHPRADAARVDAEQLRRRRI